MDKRRPPPGDEEVRRKSWPTRYRLAVGEADYASFTPMKVVMPCACTTISSAAGPILTAPGLFRRDRPAAAVPRLRHQATMSIAFAPAVADEAMRRREPRHTNSHTWRSMPWRDVK